MLNIDFSRYSHQEKFKNAIEFILNGKKVVLEEGTFDPIMPLAEWLRLDSTNLKGTKISCGEGGCGACTVIVSNIDPITHKVTHRSVDSCLMLTGQAHHQTITTVEGLGSLGTGINPVQQAIVEHHGTQCGYCTSGFVMNGTALLLNNPSPNRKEIDQHFDGNLCRCTGYRSIQEAMREFASDKKPNDRAVKVNYLGKTTGVIESPKVPSEYAYNSDDAPVHIRNKNIDFYIPQNLAQLLQLKKENPNSTIVVGGSEIAVDLKFSGPRFPVYISSHRVPELYHIALEDGKLCFGANTSLNDIHMFCLSKMAGLKPHEQRLLRELAKRLSMFSNQQIRNTACVIGNIGFGGSSTDMTNFMLATDPILTIVNAETGETRKENTDHFFTAYRTNKLKKSDIITQVEIPLCKESEHVFVFKQGRRREDEICIVSSCMKIDIDDKTNVVKNCKLAFSGMGSFPQRAPQTEAALVGREFTLENITEAAHTIEKDLPIKDLTRGGHSQFRRELGKSFLLRFFHDVQRERGLPHDESACDMIERGDVTFSVTHAKVTKDGTPIEVDVKNSEYVNLVHHHVCAGQQVTGEAVYTSDLPTPPHGLFACFVRSTIAHGNILSADYTKCLQTPGVVDVVTCKDIVGENSFGPSVRDEPLLADREVIFEGQPIAMVIATDEQTAVRAARLASIEYEELPSVTSIHEAIASRSFFDPEHNHCISDGDVEAGLRASELTIEGETEIGAQFHYYFETHTALCVPGEDGRLTVYAGTRNPSAAQSDVSRVTGVPAHKIDVRVRRVGGAFGSKDTRSVLVSNCVAVAAQKLKRPVRMTLDRATDMSLMGVRHPYYAKYRCGFSREGRINALDIAIYADAGASLDVSRSVTDRSLMHVDGSYKIPNIRAEAFLCRTNAMSRTGCRGFGTPQAALITETVIEHIAERLGKRPEDVRYANLYREGEKTHYGIALDHCNIVPSWNYVRERFDVSLERRKIEEFNRTHRYKKRGLGMTALKYGVSSWSKSSNFGAALIHIYKDGTVLVHHGGVEQGQGLNTKMCQVAATALRIPIEKVYIDETSTDIVANTLGTGASTGADLNGNAIINACNILNQRLDKFRTSDRTFEEAVREAYLSKVNLTANGFYAMPDIGFDIVKKEGNPFRYFVYGAAASVVEIDLLTGDHQIIRSDLCTDTGDSLNPAIDIGQIEGAFLQGCGWLTLEEFIQGDHGKNMFVTPGHVYTTGPAYYKIPGWNDVPLSFNVSLLPNSKNVTGVASAKGVGEPPFILSNSVAMAIVDAIKTARKQNGIDEHLKIEYPLTSDRIRIMSGTKI